MPHVIILDPNLSVGLLLRQALEAEGYKVSISRGINILNGFCEADLIMISNDNDRQSGWEIFHCLKQENTSAALMVYVLDQWSLAAARWVIEAVGEALKLRAKARHWIPQGASSALSAGHAASNRL
jgi:CheY-like chemotaxis protein